MFPPHPLGSVDWVPAAPSDFRQENPRRITEAHACRQDRREEGHTSHALVGDFPLPDAGPEESSGVQTSVPSPPGRGGAVVFCSDMTLVRAGDSLERGDAE